MKQKLITLVFLLFVLNTYSQEYKPLVQENNEWSVLSAGVGIYLSINHVKTHHYILKGDTTITRLNYKKVLYSTDSLPQSWEMVGFLREDSIEKKVWARDLEGNRGLMYDFSAMPGDEVITNNPFFWGEYSCLITGIDSILFESEYRRRLILNGGNEYWIEGVGSDNGILNSNTSELTGGFLDLLCFSDGNLSYVNPTYETCHKTNFPPQITNHYMDTAVLGQEYNFQFSLSDSSDDDNLFFDTFGGPFPPGLTLDSETGVTSGTPTQAGLNPILIIIWNNGRVTDYWETDLYVRSTTSINSIDTERAILLYPNPTKDILHLDLKNDDLTYSVKISDLTGKEVLTTNLDEQHNEINLEELVKGVYLLSVFDQETGDELITQKLIKE